MRLLLSSVLLGLAWFAAINIVASLVAWVIASTIKTFRVNASAGTLAAVRLMPAAASLLFVAAIFLPAHWRFEQAESQESFGIVLSAVAALGFGLACRSALRAVVVAVSERRLSMLLGHRGNRLGDNTFEIGELTGVSLAGILRPRILVGSAALAALSRDELDVAISHEIAHEQSRDNLTRVLMFCAPDVFGWSSAARWLEDRWQAETECEADAHAVMGDDTRAVVLASALVKVAQLTRKHSAGISSVAWSAFHVPTLLELRIRRLVAGRIAAPVVTRKRRLFVAAVVLALPVSIWVFGLSEPLHQVTEALVTYLP